MLYLEDEEKKLTSPQPTSTTDTSEPEIDLDSFVEKAAKSLGVPSIYRRMVQQESGGNTSALSSAGARGMFQLMPDTAKAIKRPDGESVNPDDPFDNAYGGLKYLRDNYDQFRSRAKSEKHAWSMAIAAYHAGPGRVEDSLKTGGDGIPDWIDDGAINTREHVYRIVSQADDSEFQFEQEPTPPTASTLDQAAAGAQGVQAPVQAQVTGQVPQNPSVTAGVNDTVGEFTTSPENPVAPETFIGSNNALGVTVPIAQTDTPDSVIERAYREVFKAKGFTEEEAHVEAKVLAERRKASGRTGAYKPLTNEPQDPGYFEASRAKGQDVVYIDGEDIDYIKQRIQQLGKEKFDKQFLETHGTEPDRLRNAFDAFVTGAAGTAASVGQGMAALSSAVDGSPTPADQHPLYLEMEKLRADAERLFPNDPRLQEEYLASKIPQGVGSSAALLTSGVLGGPVGVGVTGALSQAGSMYKEAKESGATEQQAQDAAWLGVPVGMTEAVPIAAMANRLKGIFKGVTEAGLKKALAGAGVNIVKESGEEAIQNTGQGVASNAIAKYIYDNNRDVFGDVEEDLVVGVVSAALMSGAVSSPSVALSAIKKPATEPAISEPSVTPAAPAAPAAEVKTQTQPAKQPTGIQFRVTHAETPDKAAKASARGIQIADEFIQKRTNGARQVNPNIGNTEVPEPLTKEFADWYDDAPHSPAAPEVQKSYKSLTQDVGAQYQQLVDKGIKFEPWTGTGEPYKNSAEMREDLENNNHLFYFKTEKGFGEGQDVTGHPMLEDSPFKASDGSVMPWNDVFRAVHDAYGHWVYGYEFGPRGEWNATRAHSETLAPEALPALLAETQGQNSFVNAGRHIRRQDGTLPKKGEPDYVPLEERRFADQKAAVPPAELINAWLAYNSEKATAPLPTPINSTESDSKATVSQTGEFPEQEKAGKLESKYQQTVTYNGKPAAVIREDKIKGKPRLTIQVQGEPSQRFVSPKDVVKSKPVATQKAAQPTATTNASYKVTKDVVETTKLEGPGHTEPGPDTISVDGQHIKVDSVQKEAYRKLQQTYGETIQGIKRMEISDDAKVTRIEEAKDKFKTLRKAIVTERALEAEKSQRDGFIATHTKRIKEAFGTQVNVNDVDPSVATPAQLKNFTPVTLPNKKTATVIGSAGAGKVKVRLDETNSRGQHTVATVSKNSVEAIKVPVKNRTSITQTQGQGLSVGASQAKAPQPKTAEKKKKKSQPKAKDEVLSVDNKPLAKNKRFIQTKSGEVLPVIRTSKKSVEVLKDGKRVAMHLEKSGAKYISDDEAGVELTSHPGFQQVPLSHSGSVQSQISSRNTLPKEVEENLEPLSSQESGFSMAGSDGVVYLNKTAFDGISHLFGKAFDLSGVTTKNPVQLASIVDHLKSNVRKLESGKYESYQKDTLESSKQLLDAINNTTQNREVRVAAFAIVRADKTTADVATVAKHESIHLEHLILANGELRNLATKKTWDTLNSTRAIMRLRDEIERAGKAPMYAYTPIEQLTSEIFAHFESGYWQNLGITDDVLIDAYTESVFALLEDNSKLGVRALANYALLSAKGIFENGPTKGTSNRDSRRSDSTGPENRGQGSSQEDAERETGREQEAALRDGLGEELSWKPEGFDEALNYGVDRDEPIKVEIPLSEISLHERAYNEATQNIISGNSSKSDGKPISLFYNIEDKQFLVEDGMHRLTQAYRRGDKTIPAEVWSSGYSDTIASVNKNSDFRLLNSPLGLAYKDLNLIELYHTPISNTPKKLEEVALELERKTKKAFGSLDSESSTRKRLNRAVALAEAELKYQLAQERMGKDSGRNWYKDDVAEMEEGLKKLYPELEDSNKMTLFKTVIAFTSGAAKPNENLSLAAELWDATEGLTKPLPDTKPNGTAWGLRPQVTKVATKRLQKMISEKGEDGTASWLLSEHPVREIKQWNGAVLGRLDSTKQGMFAFGPKYGAFGLNLHGQSQEVTVDQWMMRTWRRWMGTLSQMGKIQTGSLAEAPATQERKEIVESLNLVIKDIHKETGIELTPSEAQAMLWYYEQELWRKHGAKNQSQSYAGAVKNLARKKTEPKQSGLFGEAGPEDGKGRKNAFTGGVRQSDGQSSQALAQGVTKQLSRKDALKLKPGDLVKSGSVTYEVIRTPKQQSTRPLMIHVREAGNPKANARLLQLGTHKISPVDEVPLAQGIALPKKLTTEKLQKEIDKIDWQSRVERVDPSTLQPFEGDIDDPKAEYTHIFKTTEISDTLCTGFACELKHLFGGRVRLYGFGMDTNRHSRIAADFGGHDFAVVDDRFIVDPWLAEVTNGEYGTREVFDLQDKADEEIIKTLYGPREFWGEPNTPLEEQVPLAQGIANDLSSRLTFTEQQEENQNLASFDRDTWLDLVLEQTPDGVLTDKQQTEFDRLLDEAQTAQASGNDKETRKKAKALIKFYADVNPARLPELMNHVARASMLLGIQVVERNALSNALYNTIESMTRYGDWGTDWVLYTLGYNKQHESPSLVALAKSDFYALTRGVGLGVKEALKELFKPKASKLLDAEGIDRFVQARFKPYTPLAKIANLGYSLTGAQDKPFREFARARATHDLAAIVARNTKGTKAEKRAVFQALLSAPPPQIADRAEVMAQVAVFQGPNKLNDVYQRNLSKLDRVAIGRGVKAMLTWLQPFVKTNLNIGNAIFDYMGLRPVFQAMVSKDAHQFYANRAAHREAGLNFEKATRQAWNELPAEQRQAVQKAFSRGLIGWGLMLFGAGLYNASLLTPWDDDETQAYRNNVELSGAGPGHVRLGGYWIDARYAGPVAALILTGGTWAHINHRARKSESPSEERVNGTLNLMQKIVLESNPFAQTGQELLKDKNNGRIRSVVQPERFVPPLSAEVARLQDRPSVTSLSGTARDTTGDTEVQRSTNRIKARLPKTPLNPNFNRQSLPTQADVLGREKSDPNPLYPFAPKPVKEDKVVSEMNKHDVGVTRSLANKDAGGNTTESPTQLRARQKVEGKAMEDYLTRGIDSPGYNGNEKDSLKELAREGRASVKEAALTPDEKSSNSRLIVRAVEAQERARAIVDSHSELTPEQKQQVLNRVKTLFTSSKAERTKNLNLPKKLSIEADITAEVYSNPQLLKTIVEQFILEAKSFKP
jgi:hypothetical protein